MLLSEQPTYYEILELSPDATEHEIRDAYLRAKLAYNKDSIALYSLMDESETKDLLQHIEEAYQILSNPHKRREYDRKHGILTIEGELMSQVHIPNSRKIISIDRVPPMERSGETADLLVPPATDFTTVQQSPPPFRQDPPQDPFDAPAGDLPRPPSVPNTPIKRHTDQTLIQEIAQEVEWKGLFLKRVRETRNMAIEELSDATKISKTYLNAIEEETFTKLPAAVYLRGFIIQIAKVLKLPHDKVAAAYMARYYEARPDQVVR